MQRFLTDRSIFNIIDKFSYSPQLLQMIDSMDIADKQMAIFIGLTIDVANYTILGYYYEEIRRYINTSNLSFASLLVKYADDLVVLVVFSLLERSTFSDIKNELIKTSKTSLKPNRERYIHLLIDELKNDLL